MRSLWAENVTYDEVGGMAIRTDGERRYRDEIVAQIDGELDALAAGSVDAADFTLACNTRLGHQALAMEDNLVRAGYLAAWATSLPSDAPAPDFRRELAAMTAADLARVARIYGVPERRFLAEHVPIVTGAHLTWLIGAVLLVVGGETTAFVWRRRMRLTAGIGHGEA